MIHAPMHNIWQAHALTLVVAEVNARVLRAIQRVDLGLLLLLLGKGVRVRLACPAAVATTTTTALVATVATAVAPAATATATTPATTATAVATPGKARKRVGSWATCHRTQIYRRGRCTCSCNRTPGTDSWSSCDDWPRALCLYTHARMDAYLPPPER